MEEENIEFNFKTDKKKIELVLTLLFFICLIVLIIYSVKLSNDYNRLVIECNELRRNISQGIFISFNKSVGGLI